MGTLLQTQGLTRLFGGLVAVKDVSISVNSASIAGIIGPNGAGKTTLIWSRENGHPVKQP